MMLHLSDHDALTSPESKVYYKFFPSFLSIKLTLRKASTSPCLVAKCRMSVDLSIATKRHLGQLKGADLGRRGEILSLKWTMRWSDLCLAGIRLEQM